MSRLKIESNNYYQLRSGSSSIEIAIEIERKTEIDVSELLQLLNSKIETINSFAERNHQIEVAKSKTQSSEKIHQKRLKTESFPNTLRGAIDYNGNTITYNCKIESTHIASYYFNTESKLINEISCELHEKLPQEISELQKSNL